MKYIIANWKMNLNVKESLILAKQLKKVNFRKKDLEVVLCPSFEVLLEVKRIINKSGLKLGAQNLSWLDRGAFTGEISGLNLKEIGCSYVIIGHSERRQELDETNKMIREKLSASLRNRLIPIVCLGENFQEKRNHQRKKVLKKQVYDIFKGIKIKNEQKIIIAYEPVWSISTTRWGERETPEGAEEAAKFIKNLLLNLFSIKTAENNFVIIYGGSVDGSNLLSFLNQRSLEGALIGGASLKAQEFIKMIKLYV